MTEETMISESGAEIEAAVEETVAAIAEPVAAAEMEPAADVVEEAVEAVAEPALEPVAEMEAAVEAVAEPVAEVEAAVEAVAEPVAEVEAAVEAAAVAEPVVESVSEAIAEAMTAVKEAVAAVKEAVESAVAPVVEAVTAAVAKPVAEAKKPAAKSEGKSEGKDDKRVVRTLSVGQMLKGTVKRTTEFGAFVDIGVGRDGLVHISELAVGRVQKVTDVLTDGQQIDVWIKKLDQTRNRISLTMISPDTTTIKDLNEGDVVPGTVTRIVPYGAFVDIGVGRDGLLHIREMSNGYVGKPEDVVKVGETTDVRIIALNRRRGRIDLSLKGLRPGDDEPEVKEAPRGGQQQNQQNQQNQPHQQRQVEEEPVAEVDEIEVLSPMELAFKKAMQAEGIEIEIETKGKNKRSKRKQSRAAQDAIIARTLETIRE